jgi:hypothetical protein
MKVVYISGPISNMPNHNREAFDRAANKLKKEGYTAVNPLDIVDDPSSPWTECMKKDLTEMLKCDAVMVIEGWNRSAGATLEVLIASKLGLPIYDSLFNIVDIARHINPEFLKPGVPRMVM